MSQMMLDVMNLRGDRELVMLLKRLLDRCGAAHAFDSLPHQFRMRPMSKNKPELAPPVQARVAIDRNMIDISQLELAFTHTIIDRVSRQPGPMSDAPKPFFFRCRD